MSGVLAASCGPKKSAFTPPATPTLWFDAADAATITFSSGSSISQWADKSGNANHASQGTPAAQPTQRVAAQNGKNTIRFTASASQLFLLTTPITTPSGGYTVCAVVNSGGPAGGSQIQTFGNTGSNNFCSLDVSKSGNVIYTQGSYRFFNVNATIPSGYLRASVVYNGSAPSVYLSGVLQSGTGGSDGTAAIIDSIGVGDYGTANGEIAEVLFYASPLTINQIQAIETYFVTKWAVS